jgi:anthranilate phosphoribosyltransferase
MTTNPARTTPPGAAEFDPATRALLAAMAEGSWSSSQAVRFFSQVVRGETDNELLRAALVALAGRCPTSDELAGAARALLDTATPFPRPDYEFADVVGTGGDGHQTINLSTIAAITSAACGCRIIKHGNRSVTSCSGSFDFLESLGIDFGISPDASRRQIDQHRICFLFAPRYHPGMRHAAPVRQSLKMRTIFNLLGPLVNPARPPAILLGVAEPRLLRPVAEALRELGCQRAVVVHGSGVDEVAVHGPTSIVRVEGNQIESATVQPEDFGAQPFPLQELVCGDAAASHRRSAAVLAGRGSLAENTAVCVNVAMVMSLFGSDNLPQHFRTAMDVLRAGEGMKLVQRLVSEPA